VAGLLLKPALRVCRLPQPRLLITICEMRRLRGGGALARFPGLGKSRSQGAQVGRSRWFAQDSPLEGGFEPLVPLQSQHNRSTGPMSPTASIRVASVIPLGNSISISVAGGTSSSNPLSSSGESAILGPSQVLARIGTTVVPRRRPAAWLWTERSPSRLLWSLLNVPFQSPIRSLMLLHAGPRHSRDGHRCWWVCSAPFP
jgi:hypothetical protein